MSSASRSSSLQDNLGELIAPGRQLASAPLIAQLWSFRQALVSVALAARRHAGRRLLPAATTGTAWSPWSTTGCRATTATRFTSYSADIDHGGRRLRARAGLAVPDPRALLRHFADDDRAQFRPADRLVRRHWFRSFPMSARLSGFVLSVGVALVQFWPDWIPIAIVVGIFACSASSSKATSCSPSLSATASACIRSG